MPANTNPRSEPELRDFLLVLWRRKIMIAVMVVAITVAAYAVARGITKTYKATTTVAVKAQNIDTSLLEGAPIVVNPTTLAPVVSQLDTTSTAQIAARYLHPTPRDPRALLNSVTFTSNDDAGTIAITGKSSSPTEAANLANAFGRATVVGRAQQAQQDVDLAIAELQREIRSANSSSDRSNLGKQLDRLRALRASQGTNAQILDPAYVPGKPSSPKVARITAAAFALAILAAIGLAFVLEKLDRRLRSEREFREAADLPVLATVPRSAFVSNDAPLELGPREAESFRQLRAALLYFNVSGQIRSVLVSSAAKQEGKTTVATNLALAAAHQGIDVLLIDADLQRPRVGSRLHLDSRRGLSTVLSGELSLDDAVQRVDVEGGTLRVLTAGPPPPNPAELLASPRIADILDAPAELIVVDSAPLLGVSDAIPLIEHVSGVVLVGRLNSTTRDRLQSVIRLVQNAKGRALGVVATGFKPVSVTDGYGYGYGAPVPAPRKPSVNGHEPTAVPERELR